MSIAPTAYRIEGCSLAGRATAIPVTQLQAGDLVFDVDGLVHPLASVETGLDSTAWIHRQDLGYVEHLTGTIVVIRRDPQTGPGSFVEERHYG